LSLAAAHYAKSLLAKAMSALITEYKNRPVPEQRLTPLSEETSSTLKRMLKGVISSTSEPASANLQINAAKLDSNQMTPIDQANSNLNTFRKLVLSDQPHEQAIASHACELSITSSTVKQSNVIDAQARMHTIYDDVAKGQEEG
jgi:hypothetical protein